MSSRASQDTDQSSSGGGPLFTERHPLLLPTILICFVTAGIALAVWWSTGCVMPGSCKPAPWNDSETEMLRSLSLDSLPPLAPDPSNSVADDRRAAKLGHALFFDRRLSANGGISCASCHQPERHFTDAMPKGQAIAKSKRNTSSIIGSAYSPWFYWDGRKDSLWSQALGPLEDPAEHGGNRMQLVRLVAEDADYRSSYEALFGDLPDFSDQARFPAAASPLHNEDWQLAWQAMESEDRQAVNRVFANIGKAIAAYEALLQPGPARFDAYVNTVTADDSSAAEQLFSDEEVRGLRLFIGEARCTECHNGPLLTNNEFHNTGILPFPGELPDRGRSEGLRILQADPFNCMGAYSDQKAKNCMELRYVRSGKELLGAMRTPSLRNLDGTAPFMHKGQLSTLSETLEHYNDAPLATIGHNEAEPLNLSRRELRQLEAFLNTLSAPPDVDPKWLRPPPAKTESK